MLARTLLPERYKLDEEVHRGILLPKPKHERVTRLSFRVSERILLH